MPAALLSEIRQQTCRQAARDLLAKVHVEAPQEIDLEVLAFAAGELLIEEGGLDTAEGRLVTSPGKGGSIRVKAGLAEHDSQLPTRSGIMRCTPKCPMTGNILPKILLSGMMPPKRRKQMSSRLNYCSRSSCSGHGAADGFRPSHFWMA